MAATKVSFRARALDTSKPLPIYRSDENPDILDSVAVQSRAVTLAPTGMEKEEEEVPTGFFYPRSAARPESATKARS